jgi:hypothetical protein
MAQFRATRLGFYRGVRRPKDSIFAAPDTFSASWAVRVGSAEDKDEKLASNKLLDQKIPDIKAALSTLSVAELHALLNEESATRRRKSVVAAISDAIDNRVTQPPGKHEDPLS